MSTGLVPDPASSVSIVGPVDVTGAVDATIVGPDPLPVAGAVDATIVGPDPLPTDPTDDAARLLGVVSIDPDTTPAVADAESIDVAGAILEELRAIRAALELALS